MDTVDTDARYFAASRRAYRAWQGSQPQYVIPGLEAALEAAPLSATVSAVRAGGSFERELTAGAGVEGDDIAPAVSIALNPGGEPRHDAPPLEVPVRDGTRQSCPAPEPHCSGVVAASINTRRTPASSAQGHRGRPQEGA